jgi:hypothetical protein
MLMIQNQDLYDDSSQEVWHDKTDVQADALAVLHSVCDGGMQRKA